MIGHLDRLKKGLKTCLLIIRGKKEKPELL
jgi:hypothetical protein